MRNFNSINDPDTGASASVNITPSAITAPFMSPSPLPKRAGKPRGIMLKASHIKFVTEFLKTPENQKDAYLRAYPQASPWRASERAYRLLRRDDVCAEIQRRQNISATKAAISRAAVEQRLYDIVNFDFRRLFHPALMEDGTPHPRAGQPKEPHEIVDEAAQVIEAYEKVVGRYGTRVKFRTMPRLAAVELLAKLRGWDKDDGRPPVVANFRFDFAPRPGLPQHVEEVEAVSPRLCGTEELRDGSDCVQSLLQIVDERGDPDKTT